ncbi:MAG: divalent-cation tolerance protein CutA [Methanolinea sp.]|nr:divalent-cation tolerance protein CutA [Methanolinea sp.]
MAPPHHDPVRVVLTTAGREDGPRIARHLVERNLAACVNTMPVESFYRWKGNFCDDQEVLLVIKTTLSRVEELMGEVRAVHPYELPEMIVIPIEGGFPPYLEWVHTETHP